MKNRNSRGKKIYLPKTASRGISTLLCFEDKLLSGCANDLIRTLQAYTVKPSDRILKLKRNCLVIKDNEGIIVQLKQVQISNIIVPR